MRYTIATAFAIALLTTESAQAIKLHNHHKSAEHGIFGKMIAIEEAKTAEEDDLAAAKERKKKQLEDAEKEHEKLV
jgi:hypothetical protein